MGFLHWCAPQHRRSLQKASNDTNILLLLISTHRLRQLLSSVSNHHALPRCYRFPRNFRPHLKHYTVETMLHVLGSAICIVFLIEVNLMLWTVTGCRISKIPHMCCNCTQIIRLGDRVMLREDVELDGQDNLLQPNVVYCVRHVSAISGFSGGA